MQRKRSRPTLLVVTRETVVHLRDGGLQVVGGHHGVAVAEYLRDQLGVVVRHSAAPALRMHAHHTLETRLLARTRTSGLLMFRSRSCPLLRK
jgi:hypothetical protein